MKKFKTLNNWIGLAFATEYYCGNLKACVHLYENCYQLMEKHCWKRLLNLFFSNPIAVKVLYESLKKHHEHVLLFNLELMHEHHYGTDD